MARAWREEYRGGIYHVIARGNNKEYILKEDADKDYFIKLLKEYRKPNAIGEEAYRIMCENRKQVKQRKRLDEINHIQQFN